MLFRSGEIASGIAHELAQPLTAVLSQNQAGLRLARAAPGTPETVTGVLEANVRHAKRAGAIRDAQQARGMRVDTFFDRLRALRLLAVPLVTLALADAQERSGVLNARAFRAFPRRAVLSPPADTALERRLRHALVAASALLVGCALWLR